jgi:hypothetical protein
MDADEPTEADEPMEGTLAARSRLVPCLLYPWTG